MRILRVVSLAHGEFITLGAFMAVGLAAALAGVLLAMRASVSPYSGVAHLLIAFEVVAPGGLYYIITLYIGLADAFHLNWVVAMMVVTVIGGTGTLMGPVIGPALVIGLREAMAGAGFSGDQYWIVMGFLSALVLLLSPRGLWPALQRLGGLPHRTGALPPSGGRSGPCPAAMICQGLPFTGVSVTRRFAKG